MVVDAVLFWLVLLFVAVMVFLVAVLLLFIMRDTSRTARALESIEKALTRPPASK